MMIYSKDKDWVLIKLRCRHIKLKEPTSIFFRHIAGIHLNTDVLYLKIMSFNTFNTCRSRNIRW